MHWDSGRPSAVSWMCSLPSKRPTDSQYHLCMVWLLHRLRLQGLTRPRVDFSCCLLEPEKCSFGQPRCLAQKGRTPTHLRIPALWARKVGRCTGLLQLSCDKPALHTHTPGKRLLCRWSRSKRDWCKHVSVVVRSVYRCSAVLGEEQSGS